jgi:Fe-S-cluster containining protein
MACSGADVTGSDFEPVQGRSFFFGGCEGCQSRCCDGRSGVLFNQIVLGDFAAVYERFAILFIFGEKGFAKPVILLTNGREPCRYLQNFQCSIYEARPSTCRAYPLSPQIDNHLYIDRSCPAVGTEGAPLISQEGVNHSFDVKSFQDYQSQYLQTHRLFNETTESLRFEPAIQINGLLFYKLTAGLDNHYVQYHHDSLKHLEDGYFSTPPRPHLP